MSDFNEKLRDRLDKNQKFLQGIRTARLKAYKNLLRLGDEEFLTTIDGDMAKRFFRGLIVGMILTFIVLINM